MKLKNYFLVTLAIYSLVSCSNDNEFINGEIESSNATLSLAVQDNRTTKSEIKNTEKADFIKSLTIAVFNVDAYKSKAVNELIICKDTILQKGNTESITEITNIPIRTGNIKVVLFANVSKETFKGKSMLDEFLSTQLSLKNEQNGSLSMSSGVKTYTLTTGINEIGYNATTEDKPIALYRNVARVQLGTLKLIPKDEYSGNASFVPDSIFIANAKGTTRTASESEWGAVENITNPIYYCGAYPSLTGALKNTEATLWENLYYDLKTPPSQEDLVPNIDEKDTEISNSVNCTLTQGSSSVSKGSTLPLGRFFYVYENMQETTNHTLLIIRGTYTYESKPGVTITQANRFYTVTINKQGESSFDETATSHNYVKRNYFYNVSLTIKGPGSETPYDPQASANVNAQIQVSNWNVINMDEEIN